ncbi:MAG: hypothetical protein IJM68_00710 [Synergistaceae bacterium]|nr:hypothetical protein [Synergistaceae bacterium]
MQFKVKDSGHIVDVELKLWHNGLDAGWGIDESQDLMATSVDRLELDVDEGCYIITQKQLDEMLDWWQHEVDCANAAPYEYEGEGLTGTRYGHNPADYEDKPAPDEWRLQVWDEN